MWLGIILVFFFSLRQNVNNFAFKILKTFIKVVYKLKVTNWNLFIWFWSIIMSYLKYVTILLYFSIAFYIFLNVYETSQLVIDEEFHLRQGLHYCNGNFTIVSTFKEAKEKSIPTCYLLRWFLSKTWKEISKSIFT